jgi:hypothetical protein
MKPIRQSQHIRKQLATREDRELSITITQVISRVEEHVFDHSITTEQPGNTKKSSPQKGLIGFKLPQQ